MLKPLGIEKGKPFQPDARQTAILEEAAVLGDAMARNVMYEGTQREPAPRRSRARTGTGCSSSSRARKPRHYSQLDERLQYTYGAIYLSPALGVMKAGPGGELRPDVQGQGRQPLRRRQVLPPARAREPAGGGLLVADAVRQRNPFDGPEPDERRGPLVLRRAQDERRRLAGPVLRARQRRQARRATGSRRFPAGASTRCSASTAPPRRCSTAHGHCRTSSRCDADRRANQVRVVAIGTMTLAAEGAWRQ